ncbi:MAG: enoyl-CoA hydratase [Elusimicrobia bacterium]|nr:MAG: enoyl-CoA hydratase [Elusimicrobiota bacterium]
MLPELAEGQTIRFERPITEDDVLKFADVSGDKGRHHMEKDQQGRLMAHGLLTATLPTKLGGDLNYMARKMAFDFMQPVYSGDTLICVGTVVSILRRPKRLKARFSFEIKNQHGDIVATGSTFGFILDQ